MKRQKLDRPFLTSDALLCILRIASRTDPRIREVNRRAAGDSVIHVHWILLRDAHRILKLQSLEPYDMEFAERFTLVVAALLPPPAKMFNYLSIVRFTREGFFYASGRLQSHRLLPHYTVTVKIPYDRRQLTEPIVVKKKNGATLSMDIDRFMSLYASVWVPISDITSDTMLRNTEEFFKDH